MNEESFRYLTEVLKRKKLVKPTNKPPSQALGFKDIPTAKRSVIIINRSTKPAHQKIKTAVALEIRAKLDKKFREAAVFRNYIDLMKEKAEKEKKRMNREKR